MISSNVINYCNKKGLLTIESKVTHEAPSKVEVVPSSQKNNLLNYFKRG
jgi:hypothetical protein